MMSLSFQGHTPGDPKRPLSVILSHDLSDPIVCKSGKAPAQNLGEDGFCRTLPGGTSGEKRRRGEGSSIFLCALLKALRSGCSGPDNFSIKRK